MPEVWIWHRLHARITVHVLRGAESVGSTAEAEYVEVERSEALPGIDLNQLASFLEQPTASAAIRAYRAALDSE